MPTRSQSRVRILVPVLQLVEQDDQLSQSPQEYSNTKMARLKFVCQKSLVKTKNIGCTSNVQLGQNDNKQYNKQDIYTYHFLYLYLVAHLSFYHEKAIKAL